MSEMKKWPMLKFEIFTSIKPICIFYTILYSIVCITFILSYLANGNLDHSYTNAVELSSMIFLGIFGALGFIEDFKMLIQNGYLRKYIFIANILLFAVTACIMSLIDTLIGAFLHSISSDYFTMFSGLYGTNYSLLISWIWLYLVYFTICTISYMFAIFSNILGKRVWMFVAISIGLLVILVLPILVRFFIPTKILRNIITFAQSSLGFTSTGINLWNPICLFIIISVIVGITSFLIIRKTELK